MAIPTAERPPALREPWLAVWRHALKTMKAQGTWDWTLRPLLDEYVDALQAAKRCRDGVGWIDVFADHLIDNFDGDEIWEHTLALSRLAGSLPAQQDKNVRRAMALADQLILTPRAQKAQGVLAPEEAEDVDPFDALAQSDQLAARRNRA